MRILILMLVLAVAPQLFGEVVAPGEGPSPENQRNQSWRFKSFSALNNGEQGYTFNGIASFSIGDHFAEANATVGILRRAEKRFGLFDPWERFALTAGYLDLPDQAHTKVGLAYMYDDGQGGSAYDLFDSAIRGSPLKPGFRIDFGYVEERPDNPFVNSTIDDDQGIYAGGEVNLGVLYAGFLRARYTYSDIGDGGVNDLWAAAGIGSPSLNLTVGYRWIDGNGIDKNDVVYTIEAELFATIRFISYLLL